jgi:hypothetical protein
MSEAMLVGPEDEEGPELAVVEKETEEEKPATKGKSKKAG